METQLSEVLVEDNLKQFLLVVLIALSVATLSQVSPWLKKVPYTLLLVIVGLLLALADVRLVTLSPPLILLIFLPPLLFQAAWNLEWPELKQEWLAITLYAVFGVVISIAGVAFALHQWVGLNLSLALLVGASLAATDPVSVIALFKELGASKRLSMLVEGESLFNDGVAVVAFGLLLGLAVGTETSIDLPNAFVRFVSVVGLGVGVGCVIGFAISFLTQRFDLPLVEQSLTLVSAYGAYILAEDVGGSGVIAVVCAGIILGNFGSRIGMQPRTRAIVSEFWDFLAFFVNSIVFLLIGDQVHFSQLAQNWSLLIVGVLATVVSRLVAVFTLSALGNLLINPKVSFGEQTVLWWGGLRGSVSIALALSVPTSVVGGETLITTVFGVVLFTLLVQGLTIKPLLEVLKLSGEATH